MFSVLIRYQESRREVLIAAKSVEFVPPGEGDGGLLVNHGVEAEGGCHLLPTERANKDWRDVFVMNAGGQTVARYKL